MPSFCSINNDSLEIEKCTTDLILTDDTFLVNGQKNPNYKFQHGDVLYVGFTFGFWPKFNDYSGILFFWNDKKQKFIAPDWDPCERGTVPRCFSGMPPEWFYNETAGLNIQCFKVRLSDFTLMSTVPVKTVKSEEDNKIYNAYPVLYGGIVRRLWAVEFPTKKKFDVYFSTDALIDHFGEQNLLSTDLHLIF